MALKHGCSLPTGITATGVLIHRVEKTSEAVEIESMDDEGKFVAGQGKVLRIKTDILIRGEMLSTASLPAEGSSAATAASPKIDRVKTGDANEGASDFEIAAHYHEDPPASPDY